MMNETEQEKIADIIELLSNQRFFFYVILQGN